MVMTTAQQQLYEQASNPQNTVPFVTIGIVVDTNDPQQMGRIRIICGQWGDVWNSNVEDLPWAIYLSPFGGQVQVGTRGPGIQKTEGGVAYGMWSIPKVGSQVAVMCVDGNPMTRLYFGCIFDQYTPHTMPHGRYMYDDHPELQKEGGLSAAPHGPYSSSEKFIQPLADNLKQAFGNKAEPNFEFQTRGADFTVARVDASQLDQTYSKVQDDKSINYKGWTSTQGYQVSRTDPDAKSSYTSSNYDSMVTSFVSAGFHAISMDDRQENCRLRIRTTSGNQIILDDTNERIYIATAHGNNWIELDQNGNIDMYTNNNLNVHSARDINFTSDETVRIYGKKGVHIKSDEELRMFTKKDAHIKSNGNINVETSKSMYVKTGEMLQLKSMQGINIDASTMINIKSTSVLNLQSAGNVNILAGGMLLATGSAVHFNGPPAAPAEPAATNSSKESFFPSRIPMHEPWGRTMTQMDTSDDPEFGYTDDNVNRVERGTQISRGTFWRR